MTLGARPGVAPHSVNVRPAMLDVHGWFAAFVETCTTTKLSWAVTGAAHSLVEFPSMDAHEGLTKAFAAR